MPSLTPKKISTPDETRAAILRGVSTMANVVGATMGPAGKNILLDQGPFQPPRTSRDGVTVAKHVHLSDPLADLAAQLLYQVARKTADAAGDGTTTATVLAERIYREGARLTAAGANPTLLKRGIESAAAVICGVSGDDAMAGTLDELVLPATPEMIRQVGTLSANSDPALGNLIAEAMRQVGKDGTVTVEESAAGETTLEVVEGMQFNQGYLSPYFMTDMEREQCELESGDVDESGAVANPVMVYLCSTRIAHYQDILPIMNISHQNGSPLLVVAEDVTDSALSFMVVNKLKGLFRGAAVKAPGFGDRKRSLLDDLAALTGATVISPELGLKPESVTMDMLGRCRRVTVTKDDTTTVGGLGNAEMLAARRSDLRQQIERTASDFDRVRLEERLAKITGGVAVVRVGGRTEAEMKERKDRAEDAMYATRAALLEGVVPGGGSALVRAAMSASRLKFDASVTTDQKAGFNLVLRACEEPMRRIASNAGKEGGEIAAEFKRRLASEGKGFGYNAATDCFEDLVNAGILDPARVTRTALQSAASIAGILLTNDAIIADDPEAGAEVRKSLTPVMPGGAQPQLMY